MDKSRHKRILVEKRVEAAVRMEERKNTKETVEHISTTLGISRQHLYSLEKKHKQHPSMNDIEREGRPKKVTPEIERRIVREIKKFPFETSAKLTTNVNTELPPESQIKPRTFRFYAILNGLRCYRPAIKPRLSRDQIQARLEFARKYVQKDMRYWGHVLFSDEAQIVLHPLDRRERVRRPKHRRFDNQFIREKPKFGGCSLMFWGCAQYKGVGDLIGILGTVNAQSYIEILEEGIPSTVKKLNLLSFLFQDDNASSHRAKDVEIYKSKNHIKSLREWPANSPDLNIMEDIWHLFKDRVRKREPTTIGELQQFAFEEWPKIPVNEVQQKIRSLPRRLAALIKTKGKQTKY